MHHPVVKHTTSLCVRHMCAALSFIHFYLAVYCLIHLRSSKVYKFSDINTYVFAVHAAHVNIYAWVKYEQPNTPREREREKLRNSIFLSFFILFTPVWLLSNSTDYVPTFHQLNRTIFDIHEWIFLAIFLVSSNNIPVLLTFVSF